MLVMTEFAVENAIYQIGISKISVTLLRCPSG